MDSFDEDPPAPREKAKWRAGTGPRAVAERRMRESQGKDPGRQEELQRREAEQREVERQQSERHRLEQERQEAERLEAERAEVARLEAERQQVERRRKEAERQEAKRAEAERRRQEAEQLEAERQEAERRRKEAERLEAERRQKEAERLEAERRQKEAERLEAERRQQEAKRQEAERRRQEAERLEADRRRHEAQRQEAERLRQEAERQEAERRRQEAERQEAARLEAERHKQEAERQEADRQEAERRRREAERQEAGRLEAERRRQEEDWRRQEAERLEAERLAVERAEADRQRKEEQRRREAERSTAKARRNSGSAFAATAAAAPDDRAAPAGFDGAEGADARDGGFNQPGGGNVWDEDDEEPSPRPQPRRPRPNAKTEVDASWDDAPDEERARAFADTARQVQERRALKSVATVPFSIEERMLASRYLRARRKEGFISVIAALSLLGIALGVAILIIVMSVMNGFRAELVSKIVGVNGHLMVMSRLNDFQDYREIADRIRAVPGVTRAAPLVESQAFASAPRNSAGVVVRGVTKEDILTLEKVSVNPEFSMGSLSDFEGDRGVAIGQRLAFKLGLSVGDSLTLITARGKTTPFGVLPSKKSYTILYIFKVGMSHYDEGVVFMPLFEAQRFFNKNGGVDAVEVMVATPERLAGYREDIQVAAGREVLIGDWQESNRSLIGALKTERTVMFLILSFLILIASLIIIAGMIMLVKEKGKDIAILRTMGMSKGGVLRVFFMCGASIGLVGTGAGVMIGLLFCGYIDPIANFVSFLANGDVFPEDIYILSKLPAQVHAEDVFMTVGISLGLSFLATLYPAWRAARLDPVEALRYE